MVYSTGDDKHKDMDEDKDKEKDMNDKRIIHKYEKQ